jgi:hypothetical protein
MVREALERYINSVEDLKSEAARSHRFAQLLQELFGQEPGFIEQYAQGIEQVVRVRQKDRLLRGKVDNLFGNLVIEFEVDLERKRTEAEQQLQRYVHCFGRRSPSKRRRPTSASPQMGFSFRPTRRRLRTTVCSCNFWKQLTCARYRPKTPTCGWIEF